MEQFLANLTLILDTVYPYIVAILPTVTAMITAITVLIKILGAFKSLRKDVADKTDITDAKTKMNQIIADNDALRRRIDKLITIESKVVQHDNNEKV